MKKYQKKTTLAVPTSQIKTPKEWLLTLKTKTVNQSGRQEKDFIHIKKTVALNVHFAINSTSFTLSFTEIGLLEVLTKRVATGLSLI